MWTFVLFFFFFFFLIKKKKTVISLLFPALFPPIFLLFFILFFFPSYFIYIFILSFGTESAFLLIILTYISSRHLISVRLCLKMDASVSTCICFNQASFLFFLRVITCQTCVDIPPSHCQSASPPRIESLLTMPTTNGSEV